MSAPPVAEVRLLLNLADAVSTAHVLAAAAELGLIDQLTRVRRTSASSRTAANQIRTRRPGPKVNDGNARAHARNVRAVVRAYQKNECPS